MQVVETEWFYLVLMFGSWIINFILAEAIIYPCQGRADNLRIFYVWTPIYCLAKLFQVVFCISSNILNASEIIVGAAGLVGGMPSDILAEMDKVRK